MDALPLSAVAAARAMAGEAAIEAATIHKHAQNTPVKDGRPRPSVRNSSVSDMSIVSSRITCAVVRLYRGEAHRYCQQIAAEMVPPQSVGRPGQSTRCLDASPARHRVDL